MDGGFAVVDPVMSLPQTARPLPESVDEQRASLPRLVLLGVCSSALFSVTFILNRFMSLDGGYWTWAAGLRYGFTVLLLMGWLAVARRPRYLLRVLAAFWRRLPFWLLAGGVGAGIFYAGICYAADHAPGWVVAATWQTTILASPLVLRAFGKPVPRRGVLFMVLIFAGIVVLNAARLVKGIPVSQIMGSVLPVLVSAFAYPVGNQLVSRARHSGDKDFAILADPMAAVLMLSLGALPVFAALLLVTWPPSPGHGQVISTFLVALSAGCLATTLFLYARNLSSNAMKIAAVDAAQAGEVGFALLGGIVFLGGAMPDIPSFVGLGCVIAGLVGFGIAGGTTKRRAA